MTDLMWVTIITYAVVLCVMTYGFLKLEAKLIALSYEMRLVGLEMKPRWRIGI